MDVRLLLVVNNRDARIAYSKALMQLQVSLESVPSVSELHRVLPYATFSGILLDTSVMNSASGSEKAFIHDLIQIFPSVRLKFDPDTQQISVLYFGQAHDENATLQRFVESQCMGFTPRVIRDCERVELNFNVLLSKKEDFAEAETIKTITMNVSKEGCFVFTPLRWQIGEVAWLKFMELLDPAPIEVEVRWVKEWGKTLGIPGIGVCFREITPEQAAQIKDMVGGAPLSLK
ncbi:MAG: PilZ domain-containing protein [Geobacter sp.]|nr:PilZ domain-containing protein [Geobacter sp.]